MFNNFMLIGLILLFANISKADQLYDITKFTTNIVKTQDIKIAAREIGFPEHVIDTIVCIAKKESGNKIDAINHDNSKWFQRLWTIAD